MVEKIECVVAILQNYLFYSLLFEGYLMDRKQVLKNSISNVNKSSSIVYQAFVSLYR